MIAFEEVLDTLEVKVGGAVATNELPITIWYQEIMGHNIDLLSASVLTNGDTPVVGITAPIEKQHKVVVLLNVLNADTVEQTVTVQRNRNGVRYPFIVFPLAVGSRLIYTHSDGWHVLNADGTMSSATSLPVVVASDQSAVATKDGGPNWTSVFGVSSAAVVSADMTTAAAVTDAPTGGQKLVIVDIVASTDTAMSLLFEEETSGTDIFKVFVPANGTVQITPRGKIKLATANKKLTAKASVAGNVAFTVSYFSEV